MLLGAAPGPFGQVAQEKRATIGSPDLRPATRTAETQVFEDHTHSHSQHDQREHSERQEEQPHDAPSVLPHREPYAGRKRRG